jgi:sugar lactone lactonase YvrE
MTPSPSSSPSPFRQGGSAVNDPFAGDGTVATSALIRPSFLSFDVDGNLFFSDIQSGTIRRIATDGTLTTVGGTGVRAYTGDGSDPRAASFHFPAQLAVDKGSGTVYVSEPFANTVRKLDIGPFGTGLVTPVAGFPMLTPLTSTTPASTRLQYAQNRISFGNGGPALSAYTLRPSAGAWDKDDNLYFVEEEAGLVRMVEGATGIIRGVAGSVGSGYDGDGGPALLARLNGPRCVAINPSATKLYICDSQNHVVRVVDLATGVIDLFAGTPRAPGTTGLDGPATSAKLVAPEYLAARDDGTVFITEAATDRLLVVNGSTGIISSLVPNPCNTSVVAGIADVKIGRGGSSDVFPLALAHNGRDLYVVDQGRDAVRLFNFATGLVTTPFGTLDASSSAGSVLWESFGVDEWGNLFTIAYCQLFSVTNTSRTVAVSVAGSTATPNALCGDSGDGYSGGSVRFNQYGSRIALSRSRNVAIIDPMTEAPGGGANTGAVSSRIRIYRPATRVVSVRTSSEYRAAVLHTQRPTLTIPSLNVLPISCPHLHPPFFPPRTSSAQAYAGVGYSAPATAHGDGLLATNARLNYPGPVAVDSTTGTLFAAFTPTSGGVVPTAIRRVDPVTGLISTIPYTGSMIRGLVVSPDGAALFVSDNTYVKRIDLTSPFFNATNFAGTGADANTANAVGRANATALHKPSSLDVGPDGSVYISESFGVRRVFPNGSMITVAGCGGNAATGCTLSTDNTPARQALLNRGDPSASVFPTFGTSYIGGGIAVDPSGTFLYIAETLAGRIRVVNLATGIVTSALSNNVTDFRVVTPKYTTMDPGRRALVFVEAGTSRVRRVDLASGVQQVVAGSGTQSSTITNGLMALSTAFSTSIKAAASDADGNLFISDPGSGSIRMVNATSGRVATVAFRSFASGVCTSLTGTNNACDLDMAARDAAGVPSGGLPIGNTSLVPSGVRFDASGRILYFADPIYHRLRSYDTRTGLVQTVAGTGARVTCGDGGPYALAGFGAPSAASYTGTIGGIAVTSEGHVYLSDTATGRIRFINMTSGIVTTVLGRGTAAFGSSGVPGDRIQLSSPKALAVDPFDNLYFFEGNRVRKWDPVSNNLTTVWGDGTAANPWASINSPTPVPFIFNSPNNMRTGGDGVDQIAVNAAGHICLAEGAAYVRCLVNGTILRVAGNTGNSVVSQAVTGAVATNVAIGQVNGVAFDPSGTGLYVSCELGGMRLLNFAAATNGNYTLTPISTVYGRRSGSFLDLSSPYTTATGLADGGVLLANNTMFLEGLNLLVHPTSGDVFVAMNPVTSAKTTGLSMMVHAVRKSTGTLERLLGGYSCANFTWTEGMAGRDFKMRGATVLPMALLPDGSLLFADPTLAVVWRLSSTSPNAGAVVSLFAGGGTTNGCDGGLATRAALTAPSGVGVDRYGNLYVAESLFSRVRRIDAATGIISTVAGGVLPLKTVAGASALLPGFDGDGGPSALGRLSSPSDVVTDDEGRYVFIADTGNSRVRLVDMLAGTISTFSGTASPAVVKPSEMRPNQVFLQTPTGLAWDNSTRTLYVTEASGGRIRSIPMGL